MKEHINTPANLLIAEDDVYLNQQMCELLSGAGYAVDSVFDGNQALLNLASEDYQMVLLDVMLPNRDGFSVLKSLRKISEVPVIMVTAKDAKEERITGLSQGADDYVTKPFNATELLLRIEALMRRTSKAPAKNLVNALHIDDLSLDVQTQAAQVGGKGVDFTTTQFRILWQLALHRGEVLSKAFLYQQGMNRSLGSYDRGLEMHLSRIRRKLNQAGWQGDRVITVHGAGYCLK